MGLIDAKVSAKQNQYREPGKKKHFLFARVGYHEEFVVKHYNEADFYSCDDKSKLRWDLQPRSQDTTNDFASS